MKAILIDPSKGSVTEVEHDGTLDSIYKLLDITTFQAIKLSETEYVFIDEEARLKPVEHGFILIGFPEVLIGKGLVVGVNPSNGADVATKLSVEEVSGITILIPNASIFYQAARFDWYNFDWGRRWDEMKKTFPFGLTNKNN